MSCIIYKYSKRKFAGPTAQGVLDPKCTFLVPRVSLPKGRFTSPYPSAGEPRRRKTLSSWSCQWWSCSFLASSGMFFRIFLPACFVCLVFYRFAIPFGCILPPLRAENHKNLRKTCVFLKIALFAKMFQKWPPRLQKWAPGLPKWAQKPPKIVPKVVTTVWFFDLGTQNAP